MSKTNCPIYDKLEIESEFLFWQSQESLNKNHLNTFNSIIDNPPELPNNPPELETIYEDDLPASGDNNLSDNDNNFTMN